MRKPYPLPPKVRIENTQPHHVDGIRQCVRAAYRVPADDPCDDCIRDSDVAQQLKRFPEGQFVAVLPDATGTDIVVGSAHTMRISTPPATTSPPWFDVIGTRGIANHEPDGAWLYGVEMVVRPGYRRRGIGSALYRARFNLVRQLNLKGWYAVGMLMGYHRHRGHLDVVTYGEMVMRGEIRDPTVSMQINRGFRPVAVITDYLDEPDASNTGVLIIWENPDYTP